VAAWAALPLAASLLWGAADFLGGAAGRRMPVLAVVLVSQAAGLVAVSAVAAVAERDGPSGRALAAGALAGAAGVVSAPCFYRALARGPMSVVAPIVATSALVPAAVGIATGERPGALALAGMAAAVAGVVLAAREPGAGGRIPLPTVALALAATLFLGLQLVFLGEAADAGAPLWGVVAARATSVAVLGALALQRRPHLDRNAVRAVVPIGLLDTGANASFAVAAGHGDLATAAVLGSLFPVVTVGIAHLRLGERLAGWQAVGAGLAVGGALVVVGATA